MLTLFLFSFLAFFFFFRFYLAGRSAAGLASDAAAGAAAAVSAGRAATGTRDGVTATGTGTGRSRPAAACPHVYRCIGYPSKSVAPLMVCFATLLCTLCLRAAFTTARRLNKIQPMGMTPPCPNLFQSVCRMSSYKMRPICLASCRPNLSSNVVPVIVQDTIHEHDLLLSQSAAECTGRTNHYFTTLLTREALFIAHK